MMTNEMAMALILHLIMAIGKMIWQFFCLKNKRNLNFFIRYEGNWKNDQKSGKGVYFFAETGERYSGDWENDQKVEGKGVYYDKNGKQKKNSLI